MYILNYVRKRISQVKNLNNKPIYVKIVSPINMTQQIFCAKFMIKIHL